MRAFSVSLVMGNGEKDLTEEGFITFNRQVCLNGLHNLNEDGLTCMEDLSLFIFDFFGYRDHSSRRADLVID